ncbi:MAG TPA: hypothetical protein DEF51_40835 [Myxococcales bacterium]|nr:hypothetical protein [Myxococcales bacterium]
MDWVNIVERAYALGDSDEAWLRGVLEAAAPALFTAGTGMLAHVLRVTPDGPRVQQVEVIGGPPELAATARASTESAPPAAQLAMFQTGARGASGYRLLARVSPEVASIFEQTCLRATGGRCRDALGVVAHDGEGQVITIASGQREPDEIAHARRWSCVAAHLGAGWRLRRRLRSLRLEDPSVAAVLEPDGRVAHLEDGDAQDARQALANAVQAIDRARGPLRAHDADGALRLWRGLVEGRWSLVDHLDTDGRRFVVARRNSPRVQDPRGLEPRELVVAEAIGRGASLKEIAYDLGLSESLVSRRASAARRKLGLSSLAELALFFAPDGLRARMCVAELAGEELALGRLGVAEDALGGLTEAEREVTLGLLRGETNGAIAEARGTSARTVANQIARVYRKLGVASRAELAVALTGSGRRN